MSELAYLGEDGQIYLHSIETGMEQVLVSRSSPKGDESYLAWPTWSPDGDRLAFFRYELQGSEVRSCAVVVADAGGGQARDVYRSNVAAGLIYMCWSPDGERIAVLVQESNELHLRVVGSRDEQASVTVARGAPLYFVWEPDSRGLVVHTGVDQGGIRVQRILWVRIDEVQAAASIAVDGLPALGFRAPGWSTALGGATVAFERGDASEIGVLATAGGEVTTLAPAGGSPTFVWSPDGARLAFASREGEENAAYTGINVFDASTGHVSRLTEAPVSAFFWTSDNRRLVYAGATAERRMVRLSVLDVAGAEEVDLGWVRPTRDCLLLFAHFDQYSQSTALLAPGGDFVALAASRAKETENGSVPTVRQILVRPLSAGAPDQVVARGRIASWRPQH